MVGRDSLNYGRDNIGIYLGAIILSLMIGTVVLMTHRVAGTGSGIRFAVASIFNLGFTGIWAYIIYGFTGNFAFAIVGAIVLSVTTRGFTRPTFDSIYNYLRHPVAARSTSAVLQI